MTSVRFLVWLSFAAALQEVDVSFKKTLHIIHLILHVPQDMEVVDQDPVASKGFWMESSELASA